MTSQPSTLFPSGIVGAMASFIYRQAPYPIPEVALGAALGLMAGICGRAYQTPKPSQGTNLYVLVVAPTGIGKDAGSDGIDAIRHAVMQGSAHTQYPDLVSFSKFVGPSKFSSEAALERHLAAQSQSFVTVQGEFGKSLQRMSNPRGSQHDKDVGTAYLRLYSKSKHGVFYSGSAYADTSNNIPDILSPSVSIYAEGTPETVFAVTEDMIKDGLFPRFLFLEYKGAWPDLNRDPTEKPSQELVDGISQLANAALGLNQRNEVIRVQATDEASRILEAFRVELRRTLEHSPDEVSRHLWSRSHLRAIKLASLVAVGENWEVPTITRQAAEWACGLETQSTNRVSARFDNGEAGSNVAESQQDKDFRRIVFEYVSGSYDNFQCYGVLRPMFHDHVVPMAYIQRRLVNIAAFKNDRIGATNAIKRTVTNFIEAGSIVEMGKADMAARYNKTGRAFVVSDAQVFVPQS